MKGLIIKDIMCLKKQLMIFTYVIIGVLVISVMYVLSARFGNLALGGKDMMASNELSQIDVKNLGTLALVLFMLLPIATVGDMANVFEADGKAGFPKIAGALPVPLRKRLLAHYLTIYALFGIGIVIDVLIAFLLSILTDMISFRDFLGIILSAASVMSMYSAFVIFYCLLLGYGKESYAQIFSIGTLLLSLLLFRLKVLGQILKSIADSGHETEGTAEITFLWNALDFIKEKAWVLLLLAALASVLSYMCSLLVAERKRGVI